VGGCQAGAQCPGWDILCRTAIFPTEVYPTGGRNLKVSHNILTQQWQGLVHSVKEFMPK
jgi:hypothetical protein